MLGAPFGGRSGLLALAEALSASALAFFSAAAASAFFCFCFTHRLADLVVPVLVPDEPAWLPWSLLVADGDGPLLLVEELVGGACVP